MFDMVADRVLAYYTCIVLQHFLFSNNMRILSRWRSQLMFPRDFSSSRVSVVVSVECRFSEVKLRDDWDLGLSRRWHVGT